MTEIAPYSLAVLLIKQSSLTDWLRAADWVELIDAALCTYTAVSLVMVIAHGFIVGGKEECLLFCL